MIKRTSIILCTLSTSFLFAAAPPDRSVQQPAEQQSPLRRAFVNRDISLLAAARAAREATTSNAAVHADAIGTTQAAPGRAARFEAMRGHASIASGGLFTPMSQKTWTEHDQIAVIVLENARVERTQELTDQEELETRRRSHRVDRLFQRGQSLLCELGHKLATRRSRRHKRLQG